MLTLLPALLVICGRWVFWPRSAEARHGRADRRRVLGPGRAARIARAPRCGSTTALVLGPSALGLVALDASGLTNRGVVHRSRPDSVVGEEVLARHFPAGAGSPVVGRRRRRRGGAEVLAASPASGIAR